MVIDTVTIRLCSSADNVLFVSSLCRSSRTLLVNAFAYVRVGFFLALWFPTDVSESSSYRQERRVVVAIESATTEEIDAYRVFLSFGDLC